MFIGDQLGAQNSTLIAQVTVDASNTSVYFTTFEFVGGENQTTIFNGKRM